MILYLIIVYLFQCVFKPTFGYISPMIPYPGMVSNVDLNTSSVKTHLVDIASGSSLSFSSADASPGPSSSNSKIDLPATFYASVSAPEVVQLDP